jgi:hypothetical protein
LDFNSVSDNAGLSGVFNLLRTGTYMFKYTSDTKNRRRHLRLFRIRDAEQDIVLEWKPTVWLPLQKTRQISLSGLQELRFGRQEVGSHHPGFDRADGNRCISIVHADPKRLRTIDLCCQTDEDFANWKRGLQAIFRKEPDMHAGERLLGTPESQKEKRHGGPGHGSTALKEPSRGLVQFQALWRGTQERRRLSRNKNSAAPSVDERKTNGQPSKADYIGSSNVNTVNNNIINTNNIGNTSTANANSAGDLSSRTLPAQATSSPLPEGHDAAPTRKLIVTALQATNVPAPKAQDGSRWETFCMVKCGGDTKQSSPVRGGIDPRWESEFEFSVHEAAVRAGDLSLLVTVHWHEHDRHNAVIGSVKLLLLQLMRKGIQVAHACALYVCMYMSSVLCMHK